MSAREQFFKKVRQKQNPATSGDGSVEADIRTFCERMDALTRQIHRWFEGSGIEVAITTISLTDLSTVGVSLNCGASRYDIAVIRLQNKACSVSIRPEQLYQNGDKGCVTLTVDEPDRRSGKQQFYLTMAAKEGWFIQAEHDADTNKSMMTEDVFFRVIEHLA